MKAKYDIEKHVSFQKVNEVNTLCQPLFKAFGLNYFAYCQSHKNAQLTALVSDAEWLKYFVNYGHKYQNGNKLTSGFYLWEDVQQEQTIKVFREDFNHFHSFYFISEINDHVETGIFAAPKSNHHALEKCVNHLDAIQQFMLYFRNTATDLIAEADKSRLILNEFEQERNAKINAIDKQSFLDEIRLKTYRVQKGKKSYLITAQEYHCLTLLYKGYSAKEIAKQLNLSPRSVETYIAHLKTKLECFNRIDLFRIAKENDLI